MGATGYTGKLTAEYITQNLPTNIKWAVAGRNQSKLESLIKELKSLNSSRDTPAIITTDLSAPDLASIAKNTKVILNTIGPYHLYSTPIVAAAAENGTHYLDVTGETPWVKEIIDKYQAIAKKNNAILIPEIGIESAPSDIISYLGTSLVRKVWDCGVMDFIACVHELKSSGASGGTLATGLGLMDHYSMSALKEVINNPFILSPTEFEKNRQTRYPEPTTYERTATEKLTGVFKYPLLGTLTTSITAKPNVAVVQRSAGLTPLFYGFNFTYEEYMSVSSPLVGYLIHFVLVIVTFLLTIPPFRAIAKIMAKYKPGTGPTKDSTANNVIEFRGVAVAEQLGKPRKAMASFRYEGGMYALTALLLAQGGMCLLEDKSVEDLRKKFHGGGFLTPSCLGDKYVERLLDAGVKITVKQLGDIGSK